MKRLLAAWGILLAILCGTLAHSVYISAFTGELVSILERAEALAEAGDWDAAGALSQTAADKWRARQLYLHITLHHDATDGVNAALGEVSELLQCREAGEYSAANARLIKQLELAAEEERLSWKNIL